MTVGTVSIPSFISSKFSFGNLYLLGDMGNAHTETA